MYEIKLFFGKRLWDILEDNKNLISERILSEVDDEILNVDENEYMDYLFDSFKLVCPKFDFDSITFVENLRDVSNVSDYDFWSIEDTKKINVYTFMVPFEGDKNLLEAKPSTYSYPYFKYFIKGQFVCFDIEDIYNESDMNQVLFLRDESLKFMKERSKRVCEEVKQHNNVLFDLIESNFKTRKEYLIKHKKAVNVLGTPHNKKDKQTTYFVPVIDEDKSISFEENYNKNSNPIYPELNMEEYNKILSLIYKNCNGFGEYHSTYKDKWEEDLRDDIVKMLKTHITDGSITAESFNRKGKTDILIKHNQDNMFIAKCKIWKGQKELKDGISQLLSYLTVKDTKAAIIIFVYEKNFKNILNKIEENIPKHSNYEKMNEKMNESWINYVFHHNIDSDTKIDLAVLAFHLPKNW